jgi:hypothetical protein
MRKRSYFTAIVAMLFIAACSGDGDGFVGGGGGIQNLPEPGSEIIVSAVNVLASSPSLPSGPGQQLDLTVVVRDDNNVAVGGVTVILSSDSGILTVGNPVTDANGIVAATLNGGGDPTNRAITVSADANSIIGTATINVIGSTLSLSGAPALAQGDSATYTMVLSDAAGNGIVGEVVDVSSANGNTLASASLTTDVGGQAQVVATATVAGADTLTATSLGLMATQDLTVSDDSFVLTAPVQATEVLLNTMVPVELTWSVGGVAQVGQTILFSASRGTLSALSDVTVDNGMNEGVATVMISSNNAGGAVISATNAVGTTTSVNIEFVADIPAEIAVQASPFTIGPAELSTITAIVRDATNNLVKNVTVQFVLTDVTGGQLSVAQAITDSQGRAQTFYTASGTTSANNGVTVTASVQSNPAISGFVDLTVAERELFISVGTGNSIEEPNEAQYRVKFVVQISDSQGNGVEGVTVQAGILSNAYYKGEWLFFGPPANAWGQVESAGPCADEDINRNGVLDPGEDFNASGRIEAGNIAIAVAENGSGGTFVTDATGSGIIDIIYPQDHARWVDVTFEATTSVQGTESAKSSSFRLPISAADTADQDSSPPGIISPFGESANCGDTL